MDKLRGLFHTLFALWSHGLLSATLCQEIAALATEDGAQHDELWQLANCGTNGVRKGNIHRTFCWPTFAKISQFHHQ